MKASHVLSNGKFHNTECALVTLHHIFYRLLLSLLPETNPSHPTPDTCTLSPSSLFYGSTRQTGQPQLVW